MGGGGGKGGGAVTVGYRYFMSLQMGLCRGPIDEIVEIRVGDLTAFPWAQGSWNIDMWGAWNPGGPGNPYSPTITAEGSYVIQAANLFGGDKKEGGVYGTFVVMMGGPSQIYPSWIKNRLGGPVPDFRGVVTCFFDGLICSLNPYPKKWKIRHRRTNQGWDGEVWQPHLCAIWMGGGTIKAMNPAHILYECATNRDWGRGLPRWRLNEASWVHAANVLYSEGFGLCMRWGRREPLDEFVKTVVNHIGGGIYVDRETGLLNLVLIRGDYNPADLPLFDYNSGLLAVDSDEIASRENAVNEIVVRYHDPIADKDRESRAHNLASIQSLGSTNSSTISYSGIPTWDLAARVAARDLRASTTAMRRYKITLDRRAWRIHPGAVFRISAPDRGIVNLVLRVGKVTFANNDGKVVVEALLDVFGLSAAAFTQEQEGQWIPPDTAPAIVERRYVREATYRDLYLRLSSTELAEIENTASALACMAVKPSVLSLNYSIATRIGDENFVQRGTDTFSPGVALTADVSPYQTEIDFDESFELGLVTVGDLIQIDEEIMQLSDIEVDPDGTSGTLTVLRGCVDTVPAWHLADSTAIFLSDPIGSDYREYALGEEVDVKMLTISSTGTLNEAVAPTDTLYIAARHARPYPPGAVQINGEPCFNVTMVSGPLIISWAHRDRKSQADQIVSHDEASVGPEVGTTYRIRVYNRMSNTLLTTFSGITGTSYAVPDDYSGELRFELESVRGGVSSFQNYSFSVDRT
ncbi:MAG: hypothetical protein DI537_19215 [Stutzerimonas stutzeri]|nr:MAG: hypothetical protein DI537_19215 [Stutzerimonas stutzeri]